MKHNFITVCTNNEFYETNTTNRKHVFAPLFSILYTYVELTRKFLIIDRIVRFIMILNLPRSLFESKIVHQNPKHIKNSAENRTM